LTYADKVSGTHRVRNWDAAFGAGGAAIPGLPAGVARVREDDGDGADHSKQRVLEINL
jgi:hypothetical protein